MYRILLVESQSFDLHNWIQRIIFYPVEIHSSVLNRRRERNDTGLKVDEEKAGCSVVTNNPATYNILRTLQQTITQN